MSPQHNLGELRTGVDTAVEANVAAQARLARARSCWSAHARRGQATRWRRRPSSMLRLAVRVRPARRSSGPA